MTDPPSSAVGHDFGDAFGSIVLLGHTEDPLDLSPAPDHVRLFCSVCTPAALCGTEKPRLEF